MLFLNAALLTDYQVSIIFKYTCLNSMIENRRFSFDLEAVSECSLKVSPNVIETGRRISSREIHAVVHKSVFYTDNKELYRALSKYNAIFSGNWFDQCLYSSVEEDTILFEVFSSTIYRNEVQGNIRKMTEPPSRWIEMGMGRSRYTIHSNLNKVLFLFQSEKCSSLNDLIASKWQIHVPPIIRSI